jgi:hypothetical protein
MAGHTLINDLPSDCPSKLKAILKECWNKNPKTRPEMDDIISRLQSIQVDSHVYSTVSTSVKY